MRPGERGGRGTTAYRTEYLLRGARGLPRALKPLLQLLGARPRDAADPENALPGDGGGGALGGEAVARVDGGLAGATRVCFFINPRVGGAGDRSRDVSVTGSPLAHRLARVAAARFNTAYLLQPAQRGERIGRDRRGEIPIRRAVGFFWSRVEIRFGRALGRPPVALLVLLQARESLGGGRGGGAKRNIVSGLTLEKAGSKEGEKAERSLKEDSQRARPQSAAPPGERLKDKRERERRAEEAAKKSKIPRARPETARAALGGPAKKPKKAP
mmetsp:Transcript_8755/g.36676  ORF Transcript_8755/g.36676 Transcript_8755/m.36676 type:complete len:271 (-) Transcript_8755:1805-2617(-)